MGQFYDGGVAVCQHPLHAASSSSTLLHHCAAAGALELARDLVSFWGADVEALDENGMCPGDLVDTDDERGVELQKMLRRVETHAFFERRAFGPITKADIIGMDGV